MKKRHNIGMNKKASAADTIYVPLFILIIACTIFIAGYVWVSFSGSFGDMIASQAAHGYVSNVTNATIQTALTDIQVSMASFDYVFPLLVGGLLLVSLIFAFKTGASVVYAIVSLFMWALALMFSLIFTNIFGTFQVTFPTMAAQYPIVSYTMNNMKWIVLGWVFLLSVVMFTRNKNEDRQIQQMEAYQ
jgi:hypothetical protein